MDLFHFFHTASPFCSGFCCIINDTVYVSLCAAIHLRWYLSYFKFCWGPDDFYYALIDKIFFMSQHFSFNCSAICWKNKEEDVYVV